MANDVNRPMVRLVQQSAQAIATTDTALTFGAGSEDYDTNGWHDETTNNTRITVDRDGFVRLTGTLFMSASSAITTLSATISKNGTVQAPRVRHRPDATALSMSVQVTATLECAAGDYFELIGVLSLSAGTTINSNVGGSFASAFECEFITGP
jgi:TPP-dependent 2-oxoacid decarboxylase